MRPATCEYGIIKCSLPFETSERKRKCQIEALPPPNEPRRTNIGAAPSPLHLALSLIKGENADIRSVRRHPSDPYQHRQICIGAKAPMGLSLPCGKARNQANESWPLLARCGNRRAREIGELRPVCLAAKAARAWDVMAAKGSWVEGSVLAECES